MGTKQRSSDGGGQVIHAVVGSCGYLELPLADPEVIHLKSIRLGGLIPELKIIEDRQISDVLYSSLRILELEAACFRGELEETLHDIMNARAKHGVGIRTLRLAECRDLQAEPGAMV